MHTSPKLQRGTNFSHLLVNSPELLAERADYADFARVAGWGADHVRLPISHKLLQSDEPPYELTAAGLAWIDQAAAWARQAGLGLIIDLHTAAGMCFMTPEANAIWWNPVQQARFTAIWRALAERYRGPEYDHLAFELLNEPTAADPADWNHIARLGLEAVRAVDSERIVIIGSNSWNVPSTFTDLEDFHDPHVIYNVHWYEPFIFTHQRAPWVEHLTLLNMVVDYPCQLPDLTALAGTLPTPQMHEQTMLFSNELLGLDRMERWLQPVLDFRDRTGAPLFCSEFGVFEAAPPDAQLRWYRDTVDLFARHEIAWSNWDYKTDFGVVDREGNDKVVRQILFPD
ncbi:MAG: glycoside hydrolase family 5 protein [Armatimonadota bacterium]